MEIYTDGACVPNPGYGGWAFVVIENEEIVHHSYGSDPVTTNNRMELMAIYNAIKHIVLSGRDGIIHTDSTYSIGMCENIERYLIRKKNTDIANLIYFELKRARELTVNVEFKWVRGHNGNPGNEAADFYANLAASKPSCQRIT